jgi:tetratricopeptide (TPR) repeat protein
MPMILCGSKAVEGFLLCVFEIHPIDMKIHFFLFLSLISCSTSAQKKEIQKKIYSAEESVTEKYITNGAHKYSYYSPEWQLYLDSAIQLNPTVAYYYQQKAMPLFKQRKYEVGMPFLNKAVQLDSLQYIDYQAFMKCIFSKDYSGAIKDFKAAKRIKGEYAHVMDHSYDFYLGLCYLQLNDFKKSVIHLTRSIEYTKMQSGESWVHYLDLFYLGIANSELQNHEEAIKFFDQALAVYTNFSDAEYYKAHSKSKLGKYDEAKELIKQSSIHFKQGYTINEDNVYYEKYPYQVFSYFFPKEN